MTSIATPSRARFDVEPLLGADKLAVARILGEPTECRVGQRGETCAYGREVSSNLSMEVFFIDGHAANLTLPGGGLPHHPRSLQAYGISAGEPAFSRGDVFRWETTIGSTPVEVSMFEGENGNIFYTYVKSAN